MVVVMTEVSQLNELHDVVVTTKVLVDDDAMDDDMVTAVEVVEVRDETEFERGQTILGTMSSGKFNTVVIVLSE